MDTANNIDIKFGLKSIKELKYSQCDDLNSVPITADNIEVQYLTQTHINFSDNSIRIKAGAKYLYQSNELIIVECLFTFIIDNITNVISLDEESKKINFTTDIVPIFLNISIGTLRGIMFEKTKDTILEQYPLPLLDKNLMIKNNSFHIDK